MYLCNPNLENVLQMDSLKAYCIPLRGMKDGLHQFEFELDGSFFRHFESELGDKLKMEVALELNKRPDLSELSIDLAGSLQEVCDRCLSTIHIQIKSLYKVILKNGTEESDDPDLIYIHPEANELQLAPLIYDFVVLSLPLSNVLEGCQEMQPKPCDELVLQRLDSLNEISENPIWDELKKLKETD